MTDQTVKQPVMSYINIASVFKFNHGETREKTDSKHAESRLAPCQQFAHKKKRKEKKKTIKSFFKGVQGLNRGKKKKDSDMNYE